MSGLFAIWMLPCLACLGWFVVRGRGAGTTLCLLAAIVLSFPPLQSRLSAGHSASMFSRAQRFVGRPVAELERELGALEARGGDSPDGSALAELDATPWYAPLGDCRILVAVSAEQEVFLVTLDD